MNIDDAARATHMHCVYAFNADGHLLYIVKKVISGSIASPFFSTMIEAQAACDRMNLLAVLEAIRDTSLDSHRRAVLDAIVEEVGK